MTLDLDLVRQILLQIEATPANRSVGRIAVEGYDTDTVLEHLDLLSKRNLIEASVLPSGRGGARIAIVHVHGMTWEGHEFLNNARNEEVWSKTKQIVKEKGGSASFEVIKNLLTQVAMNFFGLAG